MCNITTGGIRVPYRRVSFSLPVPPPAVVRTALVAPWPRWRPRHHRRARLSLPPPLAGFPGRRARRTRSCCASWIRVSSLWSSSPLLTAARSTSSVMLSSNMNCVSSATEHADCVASHVIARSLDGASADLTARTAAATSRSDVPAAADGESVPRCPLYRARMYRHRVAVAACRRLVAPVSTELGRR